MNRCIHCESKLGENHLLPEFPIGKRLAYDPADARLWVVCPKCERWNLAWLDETERKEAVKRLEQYFSAAPDKTDAGGISVAQVGKTSLVRIGRAPWPTFAIHRYARRLLSRRRSEAAFVLFCLSAGLWSNTPAGERIMDLERTWPFHLSFFLVLFLAWYIPYRARTKGVKADGSPAKVDVSFGIHTAIRAEDAGWVLNTQVGRHHLSLRGGEAIRALSLLLPRINKNGASKKHASDAIEMIERAGGPSDFIADFLSVRAFGSTPQLVKKMPAANRLALEIAVNEEAERVALRGDLASVAVESRAAHAVAEAAQSLG